MAASRPCASPLPSTVPPASKRPPVPVLVVAPAAMVRVVPLRVKSPDAVLAPAAAATVRVTAALDLPERVAVTVLELVPPLSSMVAGSSSRVTVGTPSSSVMARVWLPGLATPPPLAVAETVTDLFGASTSLSTAVMVTVPVLVVAPAAMVRVVPLRVKSPDAVLAPAAAATVRVTAALDLPERVAVTVLELVPPLSSMVAGSSSRVTVGTPSSSVMVRVWLPGLATPPPLAVAETVTDLFGASTSLSTAVMVTVPVLVVAPAAMVRVVPLRVKSPDAVLAPAAAATVRVTAALDLPERVAVTVLELVPPLSSMVAGSSSRVTVGTPSSSVMVRVWLPGLATPPPLAVAETVTDLFGASTSLSTAVMVTVPVLVVAPAAMVRVVPLRVKSPDAVLAPAAAATVRVTAALDLPERVAVTVLELVPPLSSMVAGSSSRVTVGTPSSSVMVRVWLPGLATPPPLAVAETVTDLFGASTSLSTAVMVTVPVLVVAPAAMVRVVPLRVKSPDAVLAPAAAATVRVTAALDLPERVAVTVLELVPPLSSMVAGSSSRVTVGTPSSSVMVRVWLPGLATPPPLAVAETVTDLFGASTSLSTAVMVTVPVLVVAPAAMVRVVPLRVKSPDAVLAPAAAATVRVTAALDLPERVAVTVLELVPPLSSMVAGSSSRVTVGTPSSSVMVRVWLPGLATPPPLAVAETVTDLFGASTSLSTAVMVTVPVLVVAPAAMVRVVPLRVKSPDAVLAPAAAATVRVTAALDLPERVAVTVLELVPPLSSMVAGSSSRVTVGTPSSSVMVRVWLPGLATPPPLAVAETVTDLFGASTSLSTAVMVTVPVLVVAPAAMVRVVPLRVKSPDAVLAPAAAATVRVTAALDLPERVAVTVLELVPPLSSMVAGSSSRVTVGTPSSSVMVRVWLPGLATPPPLAVAETVTDLFGASTSLSTAVMVTVPVLVVAPAAMVRVVPLRVKSPDAVLAPAAAATVRVTAALDLPERVAVTVLELVPPLSSMVAGSSSRVTVGTPSSSVMVRVWLPGLATPPPLAVAETVTDLFGASTSLSTAVMVTVPVLVVAPAAMVRVVPLRVKSPDAVLAPAAAATVRVTAALDLPERVAVTVLELVPPLSSMVAGSSSRVTVGTPSSSVMVRVWLPGLATPPPLAVAETVTDLFGASTSLSTAVMVTVPVLVVAPAAMVRVVPLRVKSPDAVLAPAAAATVRVTAALDLPERVAVTVLELVPPLSSMVAGSSSRVTVGTPSSSVMVRVWLPGLATPPPLAVAETVTDLFGASTSLSTAVMVTVPVLVVAPAAMVRVVPLRVKSPDAVLAPAAAATVRVTAALDLPERVAVTVLELVPPLSSMVAGSSSRVTVGTPSSSVMVRVWLPGLATPPPLAVAETVTDLFGASTSLSTAVMVTVPVLVVAPAAMVRVVPLRVKSPDAVLAPAAAATVRVTAALDLPERVAVTVLELVPPLSSMVAGSSSRVTVGTPSSSVMARVWLPGLATPPPLAVAETVTDLFGASTSLSTAVMVTVPVLVVAPAAMVRVVPLRVKSPDAVLAPAAAATVRVTAALDLPERVAVTVLELVPPLSSMVAGSSSRVTVGTPSSSVMVRVWLPGLATPPPLAVAETVTDLFGASTSLSTAVMVTVPVLVVAPAAMVRVVPLRVKSPDAVLAPAAAATVRVTAALDLPERVAVTVLELVPPLSSMVAGSSSRVTVGTPSSSVMVRVWLPGLATPPPLAVAETVTDLFGPSTSLSTAVMVTVPVLVVAPAAMVRVVPLRVKSPDAVLAPAAAATVRVTAALDLPERVAVTVLELVPPLSSMVAGSSSRVTVGTPSSSVMARVWLPGLATPPPLAVAETVTDLLVTLTVAAAAGANTASGDFTLSGTTLTIAAGATTSTGTVTITAVDNDVDGPNKSVTVSATASGGGVANPGNQTLAITDDEGVPTVTLELDPATIDESGGTNSSTVTATLSGKSSAAVTLTVAAAAGANTASGDFTLSGTTLTIAAGATTSTGTVTITAVDNDVDGPNKSVTVSATASGGGVANPGNQTLAITDDDDAAPTGITLSVSPATVGEGDGENEITVTATVNGSTRYVDAKTVTVSVGGGTAISGTDYDAVSNFDITIAAGDASKAGTFDLTPNDDDLHEGSETIDVTGTSGSLTITKATITITDDDTQPSFAVADASAAEGNAITFTVTRSGAMDNVVSVKWNTKAASGDGAASTTDYTPVTTPTTLSFAKGVSRQTFTVATTEDVLAEENETFLVVLTDAVGATITTAEATGTINDDDAAPSGITLSVSPATVGEGDGENEITVTATVNGSTRYVDAKTVTVNVGGGTATSTTDYAAVPNFDITIAAGDASKAGTFDLTPTDDDLHEGSETIDVTGTSSALTITKASITLTDDDVAPTALTLSVDADTGTPGTQTSMEEDGGAKTVRVTAELGGSSTFTEARTVKVEVGAGTDSATEGADYAEVTSKSITINAGAKSGEAISLDGTLTDFTVTGTSLTLTDDENTPTATLVLTPTAIDESGGTNSSTVTATLSGKSSAAVTLTVAAAAGASTASGDFTLSGTTLTIAAGATTSTGTVTITAVDNDVDGPNKSVTVSATASGGGVANPGNQTLVITDDDAAPTGITLSVSPATVGEGDGETEITVTATVNGSTRYVDAKTVTVSVGGGTAISGTDYDAVPSFDITIAAGDASKAGTFDLEPTDDVVHEENETVDVTGSSGGLTITKASITITDNDDRSDPMLAAWLGRFGRDVAEHALDGIAGRIAASRSADMQGTVAGKALALDNPGPTPGNFGAGRSFGYAARSDPTISFDADSGSNPSDPVAMTAREVLLGSSFTATGETATGGSLALWGRTAQSSFDGQDGAFSLDGETTSAMLGADYARDGWLLGLALMQSSGKGGYSDSQARPCPAGTAGQSPCSEAVRTGGGTVKATMTAVLPYASLQVSERLRLWGALGHGSGEVTLRPEPGGTLSADISWSMAATGLRGDVITAGQGSNFSLAFTSDMLWSRTRSEKTHELAASSATVTRLRAGLEAGWQMPLEHGSWLTPRLEIGARHDGGDAETGLGVELGGGLAWTDPGRGLSLDLSARTLIVHDDDDVKDQGFAAAFSFDPQPDSARGLSLSLRQDAGGQPEGGLNALFTPEPLSARSGASGSSRSAEAAYGLPALSGRFTFTPHVGLSVAEESRDFRFGWRLTPEATAAPDLSIGLVATRRENAAARPVHGVGLGMTFRW